MPAIHRIHTCHIHAYIVGKNKKIKTLRYCISVHNNIKLNSTVKKPSLTRSSGSNGDRGEPLDNYDYKLVYQVENNIIGKYFLCLMLLHLSQLPHLTVIVVYTFYCVKFN